MILNQDMSNLFSVLFNLSLFYNLCRNILVNFATYQPSTGYSQGMSDLLAPILAELQDESDAFWCFDSLMKNVIFVSSPKDEDMEMQLVSYDILIK